MLKISKFMMLCLMLLRCGLLYNFSLMSVQAQDDADLAELFGDIGDEDITPTQKAPATPSSVVSR